MLPCLKPVILWFESRDPGVLIIFSSGKKVVASTATVLSKSEPRSLIRPRKRFWADYTRDMLIVILVGGAETA